MARKIHVLLVEDNEMSGDMLTRRLTNAEYKVTLATTAREAREFIQQKPDVVLLDIMLPDDNGLQLAQEWKSSAEFSSIPIIAVSAMALKENIERGLEAGCDAYLTKPIEFRVLKQHIQELVK
jgi:DNA-binding response OmpR family regulator